jgi:hypothetical protein
MDSPMANKPKRKVCRNAGDDINHAKRPAKNPGPRCATCWRAVSKQRKEAKADYNATQLYGVKPGFYKKMLAAQDGRCGVCKKPRRKAKRMPTDHNHKTGRVRGLVCDPCNEIIGRWGDDPEIFLNGYRYLTNPPADALLMAEDTDPVTITLAEAM